MYMAYDVLSGGLMHTLGYPSAVHGSAHVFSTETVQTNAHDDDRLHGIEQAIQRSVNRVAIKHPISNRGALYVRSICNTLQLESRHDSLLGQQGSYAQDYAGWMCPARSLTWIISSNCRGFRTLRVQ